jgi:GAF domain-containing protein
MAALAASSLSEGEELARLRRHERDLVLLYEVWLQDVSRLSAEQVLRDVAERLALATAVPIAEIYAVEGDTARALVSYDSGRWDAAWEDVVLRLTRYPTSLRAVQTGKVVMVRDLDEAMLDAPGRFSLEKWGYQSHLSVPLVAGGRVLGLVELYDYVPHDFAPDLELVRSLGEVAARVLENERLAEQARQRNRMVAELVVIGDLCAAQSEVGAAMAGVAHSLLAAVDAGSCQVFSLTPEGVLCVASHDRSGPDADAVGTLIDPSVYPTAVAAMNAHELLVVSSLDDGQLTEVELTVYRESGWASEICVPLVIRGRLRGFIDICDTKSRGYAEFADFLRTAATMVAATLENDRLRDELAGRRADLAALTALGELNVTTSDADQVLECLAARIRQSLGAADCDIFAVADDRLRCLVSVDERGRDDSVCGISFDVDRFPATAQALRSGEVVVVPSLDDPRLTERERAVMSTWGFRSEVCVPLVTEGRVNGLIDVFDRRERDYAEHREYLAAAGRVAAAVVDAALLAGELKTGGSGA